MEARYVGRCFRLFRTLSPMTSKRFGFSLLTFKRNLQDNLSKNEPIITNSKSRHYGQPVPSTHPHLVSEGQITPGLMKEEFQRRRSRLMDLIGRWQENDKPSCENHLVVIPSAIKAYMSEKIPYIFHQNTDFLYTTGFQEPNSVLVLQSHSSSNLPNHKSTIFVQKRDPENELWDGPRSGMDGALNLLGVDEAEEIDKFEHYLSKLLESNKKIVIWFDFYNCPNPRVLKIMKKFSDKSFRSVCESPRPLLQSLRLIKSNAEIALMKQSCEIASDAFKKVMQFSNEGDKCSENDLHARMEYECRIRGAQYLAYPPVVAGGNRANIIHYINNNQLIKPNELVLMDAGCYLHGYISDITRTWPIGGKFSPAQKVLYEAVLDIQQQLLSLCHQRVCLDKLHITYTRLLGDKLKELGLISNELSDSEAYLVAQDFCPHHVSHYLGMDVHDSGVIPRSLALQSGMVFTIEPGIYINENNSRVPEEFRGIGIRIEDNILMTDVGPIVLSEKCPRNVDEIESIIAKK